MTDKVTCERCTHFRPDPINPAAGMGDCEEGFGMWHPMTPHHCREFEEKADARDQA